MRPPEYRFCENDSVARQVFARPNGRSSKPPVIAARTVAAAAEVDVVEHALELVGERALVASRGRELRPLVRSGAHGVAFGARHGHLGDADRLAASFGDGERLLERQRTGKDGRRLRRLGARGTRQRHENGERRQNGHTMGTRYTNGHHASFLHYLLSCGAVFSYAGLALVFLSPPPAGSPPVPRVT